MKIDKHASLNMVDGHVSRQDFFSLILVSRETKMQILLEVTSYKIHTLTELVISKVQNLNSFPFLCTEFAKNIENIQRGNQLREDTNLGNAVGENHVSEEKNLRN